MIGIKRLDNIQYCVRDMLARKVPGDLIECGAWRGGATIFMRAALFAHNDPDRRVWVDSFEGLPAPDPSSWPKRRRRGRPRISTNGTEGCPSLWQSRGTMGTPRLRTRERAADRLRHGHRDIRAKTFIFIAKKSRIGPSADL